MPFFFFIEQYGKRHVEMICGKNRGTSVLLLAMLRHALFLGLVLWTRRMNMMTVNLRYWSSVNETTPAYICAISEGIVFLFFDVLHLLLSWTVNSWSQCASVLGCIRVEQV